MNYLNGPVPALTFLALLYLGFEIVQILLAERYLGVKQIARGDDPRTRSPSELIAFCWSFGIIAYWSWMMYLMFFTFSRPFGAALLVITTVGSVLRFNAPLRLILVVLTFEVALRIPVLVTLLGLAWQRL